MSELKIIIEAEPPKAWIEVVERGLRSHNTAATGIVEFYPVGFAIKDAGGAITGGLFGNIWDGWLHVGSLWVDRIWRGRGYATESYGGGGAICDQERMRRGFSADYSWLFPPELVARGGVV